jgi:hypothetical protein
MRGEKVQVRACRVVERAQGQRASSWLRSLEVSERARGCGACATEKSVHERRLPRRLRRRDVAERGPSRLIGRTAGRQLERWQELSWLRALTASSSSRCSSARSSLGPRHFLGRQRASEHGQRLRALETSVSAAARRAAQPRPAAAARSSARERAWAASAHHGDVGQPLQLGAQRSLGSRQLLGRQCASEHEQHLSSLATSTSRCSSTRSTASAGGSY